MLSIEGDQDFTPLLQEDYVEIQPRISLDGRWMAFSSTESGKEEVYVCPFPEVNTGLWQVSIGGGDTPLWSPDGRELFYLIEDRIMAVPVETAARQQAIQAGQPLPGRGSVFSYR